MARLRTVRTMINRAEGCPQGRHNRKPVCLALFYGDEPCWSFLERLVL
jgi:hypothetical protein